MYYTGHGQDGCSTQSTLDVVHNPNFSHPPRPEARRTDRMALVHCLYTHVALRQVSFSCLVKIMFHLIKDVFIQQHSLLVSHLQHDNPLQKWSRRDTNEGL